MDIQWGKDSYRREGNELYIGRVNMGWVQREDNETFTVHCMWMTIVDDERVAIGRLIESQYPEYHEFKTQAEAEAALLEAATVMYIGGFKGR